jgi:formiminotetrahydrofolate cyclodeaminase
MRSFSNLYVRELLDAFASTAPAPAGGSAAALAGATGVALLLMAIDIRSQRPSKSKSNDLTDTADRLRPLRPALTTLIDRDADAYSSVIEALRMPVSDAETEARQRAAYDTAMRAATEVPLETMRTCRRALGEAPVVAMICTKGTSGDVGVAIELLLAAVRGAGLTVDSNLRSLTDVEYADSVRAERKRLQSESAADAERGLGQLSVQSG